MGAGAQADRTGVPVAQIRSPSAAAAAAAAPRSRSSCSRSWAGARTRRRFHLNLVLGELTADQIAKGCAGKTGDPCPGGFRHPGVRVDEKVFLLDADRRWARCAYPPIIARQQAHRK